MKKGKEVLLFKREILATLMITVVIIAVTGISVVKIYSMEEQRCWDELEQHAKEISVNIADRIDEDRQLLSALADVFAYDGSIDTGEIDVFINSYTPRTVSSYIALLLPDDSVILPGNVLKKGPLSFREEAALGAHTSDRLTDMQDNETYVAHNYVPVVKDGETIALLIGVIDLDDFSEMQKYSAYDGEASLFVFDGPEGNDLVNTWHDALGNAYERGARPVKKGYDYDKMQQESLAGATGYIVFISQSAGEYLYYYYRPVAINNWSIALSVRESVVFKDALEMKKILTAFVVIEGFALILYLVWMLQHVKKTTQKERLQNAVLADALERAEHAGKAKSMFLSSMSHDIRTPMNAIIGFTAIAAAHIDDKDRVQDCLHKITSSGTHLLALINDVLVMSKIESGEIQLHEQACNLSEILHDFSNIIQSQVSAGELELSIDCIGVAHEYVYIDILRFNQILLNLVGNAVKYTEPGGKVWVQIQEHPSKTAEYGEYEITVKDTGVGISEEYLPNLFEVFTREESSSVNKIEGTGLGLSITKRIVDIMGGTISVESEPGMGSRFTVACPLRIQHTSGPSPFIEQLQDLKVLVVEESVQVNESLLEMLRRMGMKPKGVLSGEEALLQAAGAKDRGEDYSAYIINWQMAGGSGKDLVAQIRKRAGSAPFIFVVAPNHYFSMEDEALKAGATAVAQKPLFMSDLRTLFMNAYGLGKEAEDELQEIAVRFDGKRILLAEDNELNREIAVEILKLSHFVVETAVNGQVALDMIKTAEPGYYDAVLMDVQMPVMGGYQATREIRKLDNQEKAGIPIIALTANAFEEDRQESLKNGMDGHIAKPIDPDSVVETLKMVFQ